MMVTARSCVIVMGTASSCRMPMQRALCSRRVPVHRRIFLTITVLAVNILGDGLRDTLDPKMAKRV